VKILALDFDGVIADSARECFCVALRAWAELRPGSPLARIPEPDPARPEKAPLYRGFVEMMPLGNRAEDFGVVVAAVEAGVSLPDQAAYDAFRASFDPAELARFHERFYALRHAWQDRDPAGWRRLVAPYAAFLDVLRRRAGEVVLAIATAKDAHSVHALLRDYAIEDLFRPELVLDKETGVRKNAHLERLLSQLAVEPGELTFVDDKVNHLQQVASLGVRCVLAAWGYNGARERRVAEAAGFLVCGIDELDTKLFDGR
jgi:phosphoglycolate phosphatase-like HAD superfamily hydrolase